MTTLCEMFRQQVEIAPLRIAVHHRGIDTNYGDIAAHADSVAAWLSDHGVVRGDRVAVLLPNSAEYVACYLGIMQAGAIVVALNPDTTAYELSYTLNDAAPIAVITGSKSAAALSAAAENLSSIRLLILEAFIEVPFPNDWVTATIDETICYNGSSPTSKVSPDDLAQIIYTSGTTGRPKGVTLSHRNVAANCQSIVEYLELSATDSVFVTLPFFYSYGNSLLFTHLAVGGRLILASDFVFWNRALDLMQQQRATGFSGVPSSYAMLLHKSDFHKRDFSDLRYLTCAGGGLAPAVVDRLRGVVPEARLFLMYGQTEATARLSTLMPEEIDAKPGSIGRGIPNVTLEVHDTQGLPVPPGEVGEIVARGENVMVGYWNDQEATHNVIGHAGLKTGDLARLDDEGYIYIVGRSNDIIKSGAYRLNPKEIEEVILKLEGVAETAVVGLPDEIWGESPVAFIVPSSRAVSSTESEIKQHCRRHLPRYKVPHAVKFLESLPKTSSGKIRRAVLREAGNFSAK